MLVSDFKRHWNILFPACLPFQHPLIKLVRGDGFEPPSLFRHNQNQIETPLRKQRHERSDYRTLSLVIASKPGLLLSENVGENYLAELGLVVNLTVIGTFAGLFDGEDQIINPANYLFLFGLGNSA